MKIVVTGNMGYVGPGLVKTLRHNHPDAELVGVDLGYFGHCLTGAERLPESLLDRQVIADVRDVDAEVLAGADAVVHLAAISNDPMGKAFEDVTAQINYESSVRLAQLAKQAGATVFEINLEETPLTDYISDFLLKGNSTEIVPQIVHEVERLIMH